MKILIIIAVLVQGCLIHLVRADTFPTGEHVCNITEPVKKDITVDIPVRYNIAVQDMCGILPCMKTRTETKMDQVIRTVVTYVQKPTCCPGYAQTSNNKCAPVCLKSCNNGKCIAPGQCKCIPEPTESSPGFVGPTCGRFTCLSDNKWGSKCDRECNCPLNAYCSASTGKCLCYPGWKGDKCTEECGPSDMDSSCGDGFELPPIIEPEPNLISRDSSSMLGKLGSPASLIVEKEVPLEAEPTRSDATVFALVVSLSMCIVFCLILVAFIVRKKKEDPYYSSYSSRSTGNDTNYSGSNTYYSSSNPTLRSTGPTDFLSKNLSFATTTRNILLGIDTGKSQQQAQQDDQQRRKIAWAPKVESGLIDSQKESTQNVYSEPMTKASDELSLYATPRSPGDMSHISLDISNSTTCDEEHIYQVPKSPSAKSGERSFEADQQGDNDHEDNIYEEIKPKAPGRV